MPLFSLKYKRNSGYFIIESHEKSDKLTPTIKFVARKWFSEEFGVWY